jgi:hypothetical protein
MPVRDHTTEAEGLFTRFARRHDLTYRVDADAPVEVLWRFPEQDGLFVPIVIGLQNNDELNFGVSDFWSYMFPFDDVAADFETMLDAWMVGDARVEVLNGRHRRLQLRVEGDWRTIYDANQSLLPFGRRVRGYISNRRDGAEPV